VLNHPTIANAIDYDRVTNCYYEEWKDIYSGTNIVEKLLYGKKFSEKMIGQMIEYKKLCNKAKIWKQICNKSFLPRVGSKDQVIEYGKDMIYHLLVGVPFNLPHILILNLLKVSRGLGENMKNILYVAFFNRVLWKQGVYYNFYKIL